MLLMLVDVVLALDKVLQGQRRLFHKGGSACRTAREVDLCRVFNGDKTHLILGIGEVRHILMEVDH